MSFKPGQWISLQLPVGDHPPLNRAYSLAEPPSSTGHLTLVFDHVPGGKGSGYLGSLKPGDQLSFSGPYGHFLLPDSPSTALLLVGRYSGLVPLRCMIRSMAAQGTLPSTTLIAQAPSGAEQLYHEEFLALAAAQSDFHYLSFVTEDPAAPATADSQTDCGERTQGDPLDCRDQGLCPPPTGTLDGAGVRPKGSKTRNLRLTVGRRGFSTRGSMSLLHQVLIDRRNFYHHISRAVRDTLTSQPRL